MDLEGDVRTLILRVRRLNNILTGGIQLGYSGDGNLIGIGDGSVTGGCPRNMLLTTRGHTRISAGTGRVELGGPGQCQSVTDATDILSATVLYTGVGGSSALAFRVTVGCVDA